MKLKLFVLTAVLSGILAVSASAAVTGTGAKDEKGVARYGSAAAEMTDETKQMDILNVNAGDIFSFTVSDPGDYITVITYLEGGELGNDTILYVNQYAARDEQNNGDYTKGQATTFEYKVRSGLANGIYRLEVNSGNDKSEKLWYKLGRANLLNESGDVSTTYFIKKAFGEKISVGYKATYEGTKNGGYLSGAGFAIRKKTDEGLSKEALYSKLKDFNFKTEGNVTYGMTIYDIPSEQDLATIDVQPYVEYDNTPKAQ